MTFWDLNKDCWFGTPIWEICVSPYELIWSIFISFKEDQTQTEAAQFGEVRNFFLKTQLEHVYF